MVFVWVNCKSIRIMSLFSGKLLILLSNLVNAMHQTCDTMYARRIISFTMHFDCKYFMFQQIINFLRGCFFLFMLYIVFCYELIHLPEYFAGLPLFRLFFLAFEYILCIQVALYLTSFIFPNLGWNVSESNKL